LNASTHPGSVALPTGPWADHRYTVHFTGDARSEWPVLQFEVAYTAAESAATGLPYVSHDIGGLTVAHLADDLYVRWVQFGTFQPILRLHSSHGDRLPWNYTLDAKVAAEYFLQLRERLVPYSYTLAKEAFDTGLPIVQATYLQYPGQANAYANADSEYFYGPSLLVAPVTTAGTSAATSVWIPPGIWTNYFTGRSYTGPSKQSVVTDWNAMPVFIKAGGIVPQRTDNVANDVQNPLDQVTLIVGAGGDGSFNLYEDEGESDFPTTDAATTKIVYSEQSGARTLSIGAPSGTFTGQAATRTWTADFVGVAAPSSVSADGSTIGPSNSGMGWSYNATTATLEVRLGSSDVLLPHTIAVR
jgi:alpha-glucosidase (family GH31 glycosyl hydrolase)